MFCSYLRSPLGTFLIVVVEHGDIGPGFRKGVGDGKTNTSASTSDNGSFSLEREHAEDAGMFRCSGVSMHEGAGPGDWIGSHGRWYVENEVEGRPEE